MPDQTLTTVIRYEADQGAASQTVRAADRIEDATSDIGRAAKRAAAEQTALEQANQRAMRAATEAFEAQLRAVRSQADIYGDLASRMSAFSGLASGLGSTAFGGRMMIAADILDAVEAAQLFSAEMPELAKRLSSGRLGLNSFTVGLGAVGVALAAVSVGLLLLKDAGEERRQAVLAEIDAYERLAEMNVADLTTRQIDEQIAALEAGMAARAELIAQYEDERQAVLDSLNPLEELAEATGIIGFGADDWKAKIDELTKAQEADALVVERLRDAREADVAVTNDLDEAERKLANTRAALVMNQIDAEMEVFERSRSWTRAQAESRLAEIEARRALITDALAELAPLAADSEDVREQMTALGSEFGALGREATRLRDEILPAIAARERETEAAEAFQAALDDMSTAYQEQISLEQDLADIRQQTAEDEAQLRQAYAQDTEKLRATFERQQAERERTYLQQRAGAIENAEDRIADLRASREKDRAKAEAEYHRETLRAQEDYQRERVRRLEDHRASIQEAALRLDASAILAEQRRYAQEERRAKEDFEVDAARRAEQYRERQQQDEDAFRERLAGEREALDKQLRQLERSYEDQTRTQREAFNRQQAERVQAFNAQLAALHTAANAEMSARRTQYHDQLADLQAFHRAEDAAYARHRTGLLAKLQDIGTGARPAPPPSQPVITSNLPNAGSSGGLTLYPAGDSILTQRRVDPTRIGALLGGVPMFDFGGYMARDGLAHLRAREFVLTPETAAILERGMGARLSQAGLQQYVTSRTVGDITVNQTFGNLAGWTRAEIKDVTREAIQEAFNG